jgi:hypothetical protein
MDFQIINKDHLIIKCFNKKENKFNIINQEYYSESLIKSGFNFNSFGLYQLKNMIIEGFELERTIHKGGIYEKIFFYYYKNSEIIKSLHYEKIFESEKIIYYLDYNKGNILLNVGSNYYECIYKKGVKEIGITEWDNYKNNYKNCYYFNGNLKPHEIDEESDLEELSPYFGYYDMDD